MEAMEAKGVKCTKQCRGIGLQQGNNEGMRASREMMEWGEAAMEALGHKRGRIGVMQQHRSRTAQDREEAVQKCGEGEQGTPTNRATDERVYYKRELMPGSAKGPVEGCGGKR